MAKRVEHTVHEEKSDQGEGAFRERLAKIVEEYSVRGLARTLGVRYQNVSRYVKGTQPPASFCRRLVDKLGVNPAWLLTGEGSPMLSDVASGTSDTAKDLLELVQAMEATSRMRLGALAGNQQAKVLRELNDTLLRYEELRARLNTQSQATFRQIIKDLDSVLGNTANDEKVLPLLKAGEQISRLCDDAKLMRDFNRRRAFHANVCGDADESTRLMREILLHDLFGGETLDAPGCAAAQELCLALRLQLLLAEARRISEAALLFCDEGIKNRMEYFALLEIVALNDIDVGELKRAQERLTLVASRVEKTWRECHTMPLLALAQFLAGSIDYRVARAYGENPVPYFAAFMALWTEDAEHLADAQRCSERSEAAANPRVILTCAYVKHLLLAREGKSLSAVLALFDKAVEPLVKQRAMTAAHVYVNPVIRTQIALAADDHTRAATSFEDVDERLRAAAPRISLPVIFAAIHHRNALRLASATKSRKLAAARERASAFFKHYIDCGYLAFPSALRP